MAHHKDTAKKTNALRAVETAGLPHRFIAFDCPEAISATEVAARLGEDPDRVFKTLVTRARTGEPLVFMVPAPCELDLKKAAAAAGTKSVEMLKSRDLFPLTGYVHGGCSPIGMKSLFRTFADETALLHPAILFSGGRIGCQLEMAPADLARLIPLAFADLTC